MRADALLFGETQSRILLAVPPAAVPGVLEAARARGAPARLLGRVGGDRLVIRDAQGTRLVDAAVGDLVVTWTDALPALLRGEASARREA
jgi:phosphoribosylformylglycinamidine synthase